MTRADPMPPDRLREWAIAHPASPQASAVLVMLDDPTVCDTFLETARLVADRTFAESAAANAEAAGAAAGRQLNESTAALVAAAAEIESLKKDLKAAAVRIADQSEILTGRAESRPEGRRGMRP